MELTFEPDAVEHILPSFDVTVDDEGYIVNQNTGDRIENPEGEEVKTGDLAIVEDGSTIFVDDNFDSLVKHVERQR